VDALTTQVIDLGVVARTRAAKEQHNSMEWRPRDVLVEALHQIDTGEIAPTTLAVTWLESPVEGDGVHHDFLLSAPAETEEISILKAHFLGEAFRRAMWDTDHE